MELVDDFLDRAVVARLSVVIKALDPGNQH